MSCLALRSGVVDFSKASARRGSLTKSTARAVLFATLLSMVNSVVCRAEENADTAHTDGAVNLFVQQVQPLLESRCVACHGQETAEGALRLDSRDALLTGGDSGPAIVLSQPDKSLLLTAVNGSHAHLKMPPKEGLTAKEISTLRQWILDDAPWPQEVTIKSIAPATLAAHAGNAWTDPQNPIVRIFGGERLDLWSLKPVEHVSPATLALNDPPPHELDRYVFARWEADGIARPATADARTLARRLYFDLSGLPPTPEQVSSFEASVRSADIEQAVAELVDDLLNRPSFGEHLARMWLDVVRYSDSNGFDWDEFRPQAWRFRDYVIRSFNQDKPFDQFIREQLAGDELLDGPPQNLDEQDCLIATGFLRLGPYDNAAPLFNEQDRRRDELLADLTETTAGAFLGLTLSCCRCHDHKYDPISQADYYRFRDFFAAVRLVDDMPLAVESDDTATAVGMLMTDTIQDIPATHILFLGNYKSPRETLQAGFLSVFDPQPAIIEQPRNPRTTGRRLTLANWIASPNNPLTARVFANRVWLNLMGRPLVGTPNDFGLGGTSPSDVALLDWLASEFVRQGWSVKSLVRQIVTSETYRQTPSFTGEYFALRKPRRLTAEQLRDALLAVSGLLTSKADGPPIWPELPAEVLDSNPAFLDDNPEKTKGWYPSAPNEQAARSVFLVQKRNTRIPLLEAFDLPENSVTCARRDESTVAPQALMLLNGSLTAEAARALAMRVTTAAGQDSTAQIQALYALTLQRQPSQAELQAVEEFLSVYGLTQLCRAMLNINEFIYID